MFPRKNTVAPATGTAFVETTDILAGPGADEPEAPAPVVLTGTEAILAQRGGTHGRFEDNAHHSQLLKTYVRTVGAEKLSAVQAEALDMILHKISRALAGNPNVIDHWDDIAGYATLVSKDLKRTGQGV
jgi:hypothetical protein